MDKKFVDDERSNFVEGIFSAFIIEEGVRKLHYKKHNLIVNGARYAMAHAVGDCDNKCINQFRMGGDNILDANELLNPTSPQVTDTDIVYTTNLFVRNKTDLIGTAPAFTVSYPNSPNETSVLFRIKVGQTEANVQDPIPTVYVCAGLFIDGGSKLFSSQSFPVLTKTPQREFEFQWEIRF